MNVLFEDDGQLRAGAVLADQGTSLQVETSTGRRLKVKVANVVLRFASPPPGETLAQAAAHASALDPKFLWDVSGDERIRVRRARARVLRRERERARAGRGAAAPARRADVFLQARQGPLPEGTPRGPRRRARVGRAQEARGGADRGMVRRPQAPRAAARARGEARRCCCTGPTRARSNGRRSPPRAKRSASIRSRCSPSVARSRRRTITTTRRSSRRRSRAAPRSRRCRRSPRCPRCPSREGVRAFSIDDATTTEIDDAFSVRELPGGRLSVGVHIAVPALAIVHGSPHDAVARARLSTVYMPGRKITMLPDEVVAAFSLVAGEPRPALSLYVELDERGVPVAERTVVERVTVVANLALTCDRRGVRRAVALAPRSAVDRRAARAVEARPALRRRPRQAGHRARRLQLRRRLERADRRPRAGPRAHRAAPARIAARQARRRDDDPRQRDLGRAARDLGRPPASTACSRAAR